RVREARKVNVELILSHHNCNCASCIRSGNCTLQTIANDLGIFENPYETKCEEINWNPDFPLQRDSSKCIKCMRCIQVCDKIQGINIWDVQGTGSRTTVNVSFNRDIDTTDCTLCGQCIVNCPVGALRERDDTQRVFDALADPEIITVVQVAPAVRSAWAESLGLSDEEATVGKMVAALKRMGFNYVFDTNFSADLTIMEEGSEFLERLKDPEKAARPMFTSCCPGWIRFAKSKYPEFVRDLSTAKSPQQMFGAVAKSYFAEKIGVDPKKIFCLSVMPCVAKKAECDVPTMNDTGCDHDVDLSITTREFARMIRAEHIMPSMLEEQEFDSPLGEGTGAAVIFGATGGVMEAALRSAYYLVMGQNPDADAFSNVRGMDGWKEAEFNLNGITLKVAIVSGLANTARLLDAIKRGEVNYHFVEVMTCPGGCAGGGGQPIHDFVDIDERLELTATRGQKLYSLDKNAKVRFSHENQEVAQLYKDYMEAPLSHKAHKLLHTDHFGWKMPTE
ncbi:MAG: [FeFe] hydrogenase, group A, partial [Oscillospiraceae bacterium]